MLSADEYTIGSSALGLKESGGACHGTMGNDSAPAALPRWAESGRLRRTKPGK